MRFRELALSVAIGALATGGASLAVAEEDVEVTAKARVIAFGDSGARFQVNHDTSAGTMTFSLAEDAKVRIAQPPVVTLRTDEGPKQVTLTAVTGQPNTWRLNHAVLRETSIDGTMRIVVDGRTYDAPLVAAGVAVEPGADVRVTARHGGRVVFLRECDANVEVVHDPATGLVTVYALSPDVKIVEEPVITVTETAGPKTIELTRVDGEVVAWRVTNPVFKTTKIEGARIRVMLDGKACEAPIFVAGGGAMHGGTIVTLDGGPRFEVVRDARAGAWTFYQIDETIEGRPVVIEQPPVVVLNSPQGPRTVTLTRVEGNPRAWTLAGVDGGVSAPLDGRLRVTLFGRSLEANLGLSGIGVGVR
jgi:hypothetical protein